MILALAMAMAAVVGPPAPAEARRQTIAVHWDAMAKTCVPTVQGVDTGDIGTDRGKEALAEAIPDHGAALHLLGGAGVPYGCMVGIVDTLKHAGHYGPIGFIAEPPPR